MPKTTRSNKGTAQRTRQSFVWTAAVVSNMLLSTWLVIGFALVLPQPNAYLWGYSAALIALPSVLAVIAHVWPRECARVALVR